MIRYYGGVNAICADFTHSVTIYNGPQLGIVGTSSGEENSVENFFIPLLFIITTSPSARTAEYGFSLMITLNEQFNPVCLMSDMGEQFKIGLEKALGKSIVWLWCLFHVMQPWKRKAMQQSAIQGYGAERKKIQESKDDFDDRKENVIEKNWAPL